MAVTEGPAYELQVAIIAAIKNNADLIALCGGQTEWLCQDVPKKVVKPYVMIGEGQEVADLAECVDGSRVYMDFHAWADDFATLKKIVATLWAAISAANITLTENHLVSLNRDISRFMRDPDGVTKHAVLTLAAETEPAA